MQFSQVLFVFYINVAIVIDYFITRQSRYFFLLYENIKFILRHQKGNIKHDNRGNSFFSIEKFKLHIFYLLKSNQIIKKYFIFSYFSKQYFFNI